MSTGSLEAIDEAEDTQQLEASIAESLMRTIDPEAVRAIVLAGLAGEAGEDLLEYIRRCLALGDAPLWMRVPESELIGRAIARLVHQAVGDLVSQRWAGGLPR